MAIICNPTDLVKEAACLSCLTERQLEWVNTFLLCQILNGGGLGSGCVQCLFKYDTDISTTSGVEDDLYSSSVPGNTLTTDGQMLVAFYSGVIDVDNNNQLSAFFAGTRLIPLSNVTAVGLPGWIVRIIICRQSSTVARCFANVESSTKFYNMIDINPVDWTVPNILKITGLAVPVSGLTAKMGYVDIHA